MNAKKIKETFVEEKEFYLINNGDKICPQCGFKIEKDMKEAFNNNWCPSCGFNMTK